MKSEYLKHKFFPDESKVPPYGRYEYCVVDMEKFKEIHYFRNKLNKVPKTLSDLMKEKDKWMMLEYKKSAFHMTGEDGVYNLKFVSKPDQRYEAVYDKDGNLLTEKNDPVNMDTYNYIGPENAGGHVECDVNPYYEYGNVEGSGKGAVEEFRLASINVAKFIGAIIVDKELEKRYNRYAREFGIMPATKDSPKIHEAW